MRTVRCWIIAMLAGAGLAATSDAATVSTANFTVTARQADVAQQVARYAEYYRKSKAIEWLGRELPDWPDPCLVEVKVTFGGAGGATSFSFENGQVLGQSMVVEGSLERILHSVLPHEVTHTIFAAKFRRPLPRWADEGGAVLSEDQEEIARHDLLVRKIINRGGMIPLRRLFVLTEYPRDVMALYAQGFSVARYLVSLRGRQQFLDFVDQGQQIGWDHAVHRHYGFASVDALEYQWIEWLRAGRGTGADGPPDVASAQQRQPRPEVAQGSADSTRPVFRGQIPEEQPQTVYLSDSSNGPNAADDLRSGRSAGVDEPVVRTSREAASRPVIGARDRDDAPGRLPIGMPSASSEDDSPPRAILQQRLIPIAVGRTRRTHHQQGSVIPPAQSRVVDE